MHWYLLQGCCTHVYIYVFSNLVVVVVLSKAGIYRKREPLQNWQPMQDFLPPLKVSHKKTLMLFPQKRAVVWQAGAACLAGTMFLSYQRDDRPILITLRIQHYNLSLSSWSRLCTSSTKAHSPKPEAYWLLLILESLHCGKTWEAIELMEEGNSKSHCLHLRWQVNVFERKYGLDPLAPK